MASAPFEHHLRQLDKARTSAATWDRHWDVQDTIANWDTFSFEEQQAFLLMHISKIVVHDESVEVLILALRM